MNQYQPNFKNPKVRRRIQTALDYVETYVSPRTPKSIYTREIDRHFGQVQKNLSQYLRQQLLVCVDPYYNMETGVCKKYIQNRDGLAQLKTAFNHQPQTPPAVLIAQTELDTGEFEYRDSSNRLWHPLQSLPRKIKQTNLARSGYIYNYDIICSAPSLLYQHAQHLGMESSLAAIEVYIESRSQIRDHISSAYSIDVQSVKRIITGLFQGGYISHHYTSRTYKELSGNHSAIQALKSDPVIQALQQDIKTLWEFIGSHQDRDTITTRSGQTRKRSLTGKIKASIYREQERIVLDSVRSYLNKTNNKGFMEHDGWTTQQVIDITDLRSYVKSHTGYWINIDWEILEQ